MLPTVCVNLLNMSLQMTWRAPVNSFLLLFLKFLNLGLWILDSYNFLNSSGTSLSEPQLPQQLELIISLSVTYLRSSINLFKPCVHPHVIDIIRDHIIRGEAFEKMAFCHLSGSTLCSTYLASFQSSVPRCLGGTIAGDNLQNESLKRQLREEMEIQKGCITWGSK